MKATGALMIVIAAPAFGADNDLQQWTSVSASGSIKGDIVGQVEANIRLGDDLRRVRQTLTRGTIGYRTSPQLTLSLGYGHITAYRANARDIAEERLYQQAQLTIGKLGPGVLTTRARLEQRFVRPGSDTGWRYRQQLRWVMPLKKDGPSLILQTEPFFALNSTDWGARAGFDQIRALVGVALPVTKRVTLESGYQLQYVRSPTRDRANHIVPVTVAFRW